MSFRVGGHLFTQIRGEGNLKKKKKKYRNNVDAWVHNFLMNDNSLI